MELEYTVRIELPRGYDAVCWCTGNLRDEDWHYLTYNDKHAIFRVYTEEAFVMLSLLYG